LKTIRRQAIKAEYELGQVRKEADEVSREALDKAEEMKKQANQKVEEMTLKCRQLSLDLEKAAASERLNTAAQERDRAERQLKDVISALD